MGGRAILALLSAGGLLMSVTACTSSHPSTPTPSPSVVTTTVTAAPSSGSSAPTIATSSTAPSGPTSTAPTGQPGAGGCTTAGLAVAIQRGSGASGQVISTITFTNQTAASCTLTGYPGVSLLAGGSQIGQPATRTGAPISTVTVAAGATVSSQLTDTTTCNASESDTVRIYLPNQTISVDLPVLLRACSLTVTPVAG
jgi:hypothetical protein